MWMSEKNTEFTLTLSRVVKEKKEIPKISEQ